MGPKGGRAIEIATFAVVYRRLKSTRPFCPHLRGYRVGLSPGRGSGGEGPALPAGHGTANTTDIVQMNYSILRNILKVG